MRQTFPLTHPRHKPAQAVALLKNRIRKYLKRERRKPLPEGVDFWDFDCRAGDDEASAAPVHVAAIIDHIDDAVLRDAQTIYIEILAKPGHRTPRPPAE